MGTRRRLGLLLSVGLVVGIVIFDAALATAQTLSITPIREPLRVRPENAGAEFPLAVVVCRDGVRNLRLRPLAAHDLTRGVAVGHGWLSVLPREIERSGSGRRIFRLRVDADELPPSGVYRVRVEARAAGNVHKSAFLTFLVGPDGTPALAPQTSTSASMGHVGGRWWLPRIYRFYDSESVRVVLSNGSPDGVLNRVVLTAGGLVEEDSGVTVGGAQLSVVPKSTPTQTPSVDSAAGSADSESRCGSSPPRAGTEGRDSTSGATAVTSLLGSGSRLVELKLPAPLHPGVYKATVTARAVGSSASPSESVVTIVVTDGPWVAILVLAAGVLLSFGVGYLRGKRQDVSLERQAASFVARIEDFLQRNLNVAELPAFRELRRASRQVQVLARSSGVEPALSYLRNLETVYQFLAELSSAATAVKQLGDELKMRKKEVSSGDEAQRALWTEVRSSVDQAITKQQNWSKTLYELLDKDSLGPDTAFATLVAKMDGLKKEADGLPNVLQEAMEKLGPSTALRFSEAAASKGGDEEKPPADGGLPLADPALVVNPPRPRADEPISIQLVPPLSAGWTVEWRVWRPGLKRPVLWLRRLIYRLRWVRSRAALYNPLHASIEGGRLSYTFYRKGLYVVSAVALRPDGRGVFGTYTKVRVRRSLSASQGWRLTLIDAGLSAISFVFAVVTGMWLFYYREGLQYFGDPEHYFQLFLWGIGIDTATKTLKNVRSKVEVLPPQ